LRLPNTTRGSLIAVQKPANAAPMLRVQTVAPLSSQAICRLGLEPGLAFDLTS